jgi:hypothetical protein
MQFIYNANGKPVRGKFYCKGHWPHEHWKEVEEERKELRSRAW